MKCPSCSSKTKVIDVRDKYRFYRRRECKSCGERFTTYEVTTEDILHILDEHLSEEQTDEIAGVLEYEFPTKEYNISKSLANLEKGWNRGKQPAQAR